MTGSKAALYVHIESLSEWKSCGALQTLRYVFCDACYMHPVCVYRIHTCVCEPPRQKIMKYVFYVPGRSRSALAPSDWLTSAAPHLCVCIFVYFTLPCAGWRDFNSFNTCEGSTHTNFIYIIMNADVFHDLSWHAFAVLIFYYPTPRCWFQSSLALYCLGELARLLYVWGAQSVTHT